MRLTDGQYTELALLLMQHGTFDKARPGNAARRIGNRTQPLALNYSDSSLQTEEGPFADFFDVLRPSSSFDQVHMAVWSAVESARYYLGVKSCSHIAAIFADSMLLQSERGLTHLHAVYDQTSSIRGNWAVSWAQPIWLNDLPGNGHRFGWFPNKEGKLLQPRDYVDYERLQKLDQARPCYEVLLPRDPDIATQIVFDSARHPHYQTYDPDLWMWVVMDNCRFTKTPEQTGPAFHYRTQ